MKYLENDNNLEDVVIVNDTNQQDYICSLFEKAKQVSKLAEGIDGPADVFEEELNQIKKQFRINNHTQGVLFCEKCLVNIQEKRGDNEKDLSIKLGYYEVANDSIDSAILRAGEIGWNQPSLFKRQAIIKSKLADTLHLMGEHYDANILDSTAFKIFGSLLKEHPDYAEVQLESATASFRKIKWSLRKTLSDLAKAENLLNHPKHTKHLPDMNELNRFKQRIFDLRDSINLILSLA